ncbi:O-antigen ligase family protein [Alkaliphilus serpentinus]|uniref:O-antigen ligase-related domain-containing protein n=1 Tax=Alkaliphilus serpentinus TaxID=1482731 RepID=A0A833M9Z1_9FIRM|nr:O-antigen ligase family protein [Alkaliphilus serpentinus]KAB3529714.1 hypothetical protein F8153_08935 [Alkaliphilus serpentinus]
MPKIAKQKTSKKYLNNNDTASKIGLFVFAVACLLIFTAPLLRGLFFTKEVLLTHLISFGLFALWIVKKYFKEEKIILSNPMDYLGLLLVVAYLLPILFQQAVSLRDAIGEALKYINAYFLYLLVKDYAHEIKHRIIIMYSIVLSGVTVAIVGIGSLGGYISLTDSVIGNRISSTFQYPNTLAAMMMTCLFIALGLMLEEDNRWKAYANGVMAYILFFTFIFTYSRAAWLVFPLFFLLYILAIPNMKKIIAILFGISIVIPTLLVMQPFTQVTSSENQGNIKLIGIFIVGIIGFTLLHWVFQWIASKLQSVSVKTLVIIPLIGVLLAGSLGVLAFNITEPLVFDNLNASENKWNSIRRTIEVYPNQNYILSVNVGVEGSNEKQWTWRIRVFGADDKGEQALLDDRIAEVGESGYIKIPFTTELTTEKALIDFTAVHPGIKVTFDEAMLLDGKSNFIQNIKLKYKYLPESLISRLNAIDLNENSSSARLAFYKDGGKIFYDYPIIGAGGKAWGYLYSAYQSYTYYSNEPHNLYLRVLVETGIIGLLVILILLLLLGVELYKAARRYCTINISLVIATLVLLAHSGLDFNFAYFSIILLLFTILSLIQWEPMLNIKILRWTYSRRKVNLAGAFMLSIIFLLFTSSLYTGYSNAMEAVKEAEKGNGGKSLALYQKAVIRDPFSAKYRVDLAQLLRASAQQTQQQKLIFEADKHISAALNNSPYDLDVSYHAIAHFLQRGKFDEAQEIAEDLVKNNPYKPEIYQIKLDAYSSIGDYFMQQEDTKEALKMYEKAMSIKEDIMRANKKTDKKIIQTSATQAKYNKLQYFIKNIESPNKLLQLADYVYISYFSTDFDENNVPDYWRIWNPQNKTQRIESSQKGMKLENIEGDRGGVYSSDISLQPNTKYQVEVEFSEDTNLENARVWVFSRSGEVSLQHQQNSVSSHSESFEFQTQPDIEPGNQYIIVEHKGLSNNSLSVKNFKIIQINNNVID